MAATGSSVRLGRLRRRFGIGAPRLAIRAHVAWYWKVAVALLILLFAATSSFAIFEAGKRFATGGVGSPINEALVLGGRVIKLDAELVKARRQVDAVESDLKVEQATVKQLSRQVKSLELDNALLKEDLAFFEGLMPSPAGEGESVRIEHLRIEPDASPGEYRYRMLIINSGRGEKKGFKGQLQLIVKVTQEGTSSVLSIPGEAQSDLNMSQYSFESRYFRRLEGVFSVPSGAVVVGAEARVLQDGEVRAKQYVNL